MELSIAIELALAEAKRKDDLGLLIPVYLWDDETHSVMSDDGDFETVHSITSLYSDDEKNDGSWDKAINDALFHEYPTYF